MSIFFILILLLVLVLGFGFGLTIWYAARQKQAAAKEAGEKGIKETVRFRWGYIMLPVAVLILSIVLAMVLYPRLPAAVGYHFGSDGVPRRWFSREAAVALAVVPQFLLVLLGSSIIWLTTKLGLFSRQDDTVMKSSGVLSLMGNTAVIPQIIIGLVILDIFTYNVQGIHFLPAWAFLALPGIVIVTLLLILALIIKKVSTSQLETKKGQQ